MTFTDFSIFGGFHVDSFDKFDRQLISKARKINKERRTCWLSRGARTRGDNEGSPGKRMVPRKLWVSQTFFDPISKSQTPLE